ncbi:hypothetical protein O4H48_22840, partial [Rhodobacteraceae bacterium G21628-S1]|nr:hypothetical protein [Rhodobacteraceae bacterium G21628-S1]
LWYLGFSRSRISLRGANAAQCPGMPQLAGHIHTGIPALNAGSTGGCTIRLPRNNIPTLVVSLSNHE